MTNKTLPPTSLAALLLLLTAGAPRASADVSDFTNCGLSGTCANATPPYGLCQAHPEREQCQDRQALTSGNLFVDTVAGGGYLFVFNYTMDSKHATQPGTDADGTGDFSARGICADTTKQCDGSSTPDANDIHFDVTHPTLAQLETANPKGQNGGPNKKEDIKNTNSNSVPDGGITLTLLGVALIGVETLRRTLRV